MNTFTINAIIADLNVTAEADYNFVEMNSKASFERRALMIVPKLKSLVKNDLINGDLIVTFHNVNASSQKGTYDECQFLDNNGNFVGGINFQTWGLEDTGSAYFWVNDKENDERIVTYFDKWSTMKKEMKDPEVAQTFRDIFHKDYVAPVIEEETKEVEAISETPDATKNDDNVPAKRTHNRKKIATKTTKKEEVIVNEDDVIA